MAQLSDDCFAFGGKLASLEVAQASLIASAQQSQGGETLPLNQLAGRILAQDLMAARHVPPFHNSAVDGYAYIHGQGPRLSVTQTIAAGATPGARLGPQTAMRVLTGAPLPHGADTVIMDEDATLDGGSLTINPALKKGSNWRPKGEDIAAGQVLYPAGHVLRSVDLARLAAAGLQGAVVRKRLKIHILSSGDEIKSGQVVDANRWLLSSVFSAPAFDLHFGSTVGDDLDETLAALNPVDTDLILTSGGVSVGERDVLRHAIEQLGQIEFWRVGIKPGRPVAFGQVNGTPIFGLPGNPVACFITALFLALPYALAALGAGWQPKSFEVEVATVLKKKPGRTEFVRAHVDAGMATPYAVSGAGVLSSLTQTDGLLVLGSDLTEVTVGTRVPFLPFEGIIQ